MGHLDPPLGNTRLQVVRLLAVLIPSDHDQLHGQLISLGTFQVMLDLFFKYPWNNFLHTQVENCLVAALDVGSGDESQVITTLRKHVSYFLCVVSIFLWICVCAVDWHL